MAMEGGRGGGHLDGATLEARLSEQPAAQRAFPEPVEALATQLCKRCYRARYHPGAIVQAERHFAQPGEATNGQAQGPGLVRAWPARALVEQAHAEGLLSPGLDQSGGKGVP